MGTSCNTLKRYMTKESREIKNNFKQVNDSMLTVKDNQDKFEVQIRMKMESLVKLQEKTHDDLMEKINAIKSRQEVSRSNDY